MLFLNQALRPGCLEHSYWLVGSPRAVRMRAGPVWGGAGRMKL